MSDNPTPLKPEESNWFNEHSGITGQSKLFNIDRERERAATVGNQERIPDPEATVDREDIIGEEKKIPTFKNPFVKSAIVVTVIGALVGGSTMLYLQNGRTPPIAEKKPVTEDFQNGVVPDSQIKGELALSKQNAELSLNKPVANTPTAVVVKPTTAPVTVATTPTKPITPTKSIVVAKPVPTPTPIRRIQSTPYQPQTFNPPRSSQAYPQPRPVPIYKAAKTYNVARSQPASFNPPRQQVAYKPTPFAPMPRPMTPAQPMTPITPATPPAALVSWKDQSTGATFGGRYQNINNTNSATNGTKPSVATPQTYLASENEIFETPGDPPKIVQIGTKARGILLTPVQLSASEAMDQTIAIGLNQPLLDRRGKIVVPAGSQIQFKISAMSNGWIKASSQKVYIDGQSYDAEDVFSITTSNGQPLIAESKQFGGDVVSQQDRRSFIFSALQKVGSVLTQPDTQSTINANAGGLATSNTTTPKRDILGAILDGGFSPVAAAQISRSQKQINELLSASKLWFLPIGSEIQIITTQQSRF